MTLSIEHLNWSHVTYIIRIFFNVIEVTNIDIDFFDKKVEVSPKMPAAIQAICVLKKRVNIQPRRPANIVELTQKVAGHAPSK